MTKYNDERAARTRALVNGRAWDKTEWQRVCIKLPPGLTDLARQYGICSINGRGGCQPLGEWVQDRLVEVIREKQAKQNEHAKKMLEQRLEDVKKGM